MVDQSEYIDKHRSTTAPHVFASVHAPALYFTSVLRAQVNVFQSEKDDFIDISNIGGHKFFYPNPTNLDIRAQPILQTPMSITPFSSTWETHVRLCNSFKCSDVLT